MNERPEAVRQLDLADYIALDIGGGRSLFNRSGLTFRETGEWFLAIAAIDQEAARTGRFVAASIALAGIEGAVTIASTAREAGPRVFELSVGVPHASEALPGTIARETGPVRLRASFRGCGGKPREWRFPSAFDHSPREALQSFSAL